MRVCRRRSGAGAHQFHRPRSVIVAGTSRQRTTVASMSTAVASPMPTCSMAPSLAAAKQPNTMTISSAAEVMTRPVC